MSEISEKPFENQILWFIGSLVYYKAILEFALDRPISIIGAVLMSIVLTIFVFRCARKYLKIVQDVIHTAREGESRALWIPLLKTFIIEGIAFASASKLIVYGFSKEFNYKLGGDLFYSIDYEYEETSIFVSIILAPLLFQLFKGIPHFNKIAKKAQTLRDLHAKDG